MSKDAAVRLDLFDNSSFDRGAGFLRQLAWYLVSAILFQTQVFPLSAIKRRLLQIFGARVGQGLVIKPSVRIKYPWRLTVGDHVWIGEGVWIDNLADVRIGDHVCISQGSMLLTGSHDYRSNDFALIAKAIVVESESWIGAKTLITPGVTVGKGVVLAAGSVATHNLEPGQIYQGNPASLKRSRFYQS